MNEASVDNFTVSQPNLSDRVPIGATWQNAHPNTDLNTQGLPQVVWLRGDEPYVDEFSLDADEVMVMLGIKRTRLTQISGKELRVGRKRVDRYVRPVFRPCDVDEYLQKSRAPVTHQKSSKIIEDAAQKLRSSSEQVREDISGDIEDFKERLTETLTLRSQALEDALSQGVAHQVRLLQRMEEHFREFGESFADRINATALHNERLFLNAQKHIAESSSHILEAMKGPLFGELKQSIEQQSAWTKEFHKSLWDKLELMHIDVRNSSRAQENLQESLMQMFKELIEVIHAFTEKTTRMQNKMFSHVNMNQKPKRRQPGRQGSRI